MTGLFFALSPGIHAASLQKRLSLIDQNEPDLADVIRTALRNEHLDWGQMEQWKKRMKKAAWLPQLFFGYDKALKESTGISITDNISVTSSSVTVGPEDNDYDQTVNRGDTFRVKAVWNLDELVFHRSALQWQKETRDHHGERLKFIAYLSSLYQKRRQAIIDYHGHQSRRTDLQIAILTDQLDFFTGGKFSAQWWRHP